MSAAKTIWRFRAQVYDGRLCYVSATIGTSYRFECRLSTAVAQVSIPIFVPRRDPLLGIRLPPALEASYEELILNNLATKSFELVRNPSSRSLPGARVQT